MKKALKVFLIFVISVTILAGAAAFIAPAFLTAPLKKALTEEFNRQTDQDFILDFSTFDIGILMRSITVDSIVVRPDSASPTINKVSAASVSIEGIKWLSLINKPFPNFDRIIIQEPDVELYLRDFSSSTFTNSGNSTNNDIAKKPASFNLIINDGQGRIIRPNKQEVFRVDNISVEANDVNINKLLDGSQFIFMDNLIVDGSGLRFSMERKLYEITAGDFTFNKNSQYASLADFNLTPLAPKYRFSEIKNRQIDRIDLSIPNIEFIGFEMSTLANKHFELDSLHIAGARMEVFRDKYKERPPGINPKPLLYEIATSTDFSFGLNKAVISNADITYEEHKPPAQKTGSITFNNINASIQDFRTKSHPEFREDSLKLDVETLFMNTSRMTLDVGYATFDRNNTHTISVNLDSFDPKEAGDMLQHVGFVRIEDGLVENMRANYTLNTAKASGEVKILYRDLKVSFLNKDNPEKTGLKQQFGDFIANTFVLKSDNLGEDPRIGAINFEREIEKSIFAYWWKSLLDGIKEVIR
ncbi:hypothetical protein [Gracilimonas sp. BCB1]|uniref:hypothetical protein n=1 Tax=Gracilimonas sp. BCB1 TaxID=3152362 RepID=UPI0032D8ED31